MTAGGAPPDRHWLMRLLRDPPDHVSSYFLVSGLFLRLLALIYLAAFVSIGVQIDALAGPDGILPLADHLEFLRERHGIAAWWRAPTLFWFDQGTAALQGAAIAGAVLSVMLLLGFMQRTALILLFILYLSLFHAGQIFMNFQWDYLLLEAGFLAIFLPGGSRIVIWLLRWLLFRFRFLSGISKLLSADPTWAGLTALDFYFEVQPLPHTGSWYAHQLPEWLLRGATGAVLVIEILVPFLMFMARGPRLFAAWATIGLQVIIILTSNHNFFNFLVIALCLFLFDDQALRRMVPARAAAWLTSGLRGAGRRPLRDGLIGALAAVIVALSFLQMWQMIVGRPGPRPLEVVMENLRGLRIVNKYHVFPTMKTERIEIILEGSRDGEHWRTYEFRYKPGDTARRPQVVIPHQPRVDWMMWFASATPIFLGWYHQFQLRLLEGSPAVTAVMGSNPFPDDPPRYLRSSAYRYHFTDRQTRSETGQWWTREYLGPFYPLPWVAAPPAGQ